MDEAMDSEKLNLPREQYEPVVSQPVDMEFMGSEITLCVFDIGGDHEIKTCYGDICKTVNALRDYSRLLEMVCDTWDLQGFHRAKYEFEAKKLREVADKFQAGIGYDYDAAVEHCRKKPRNEDIGGEALAMGFLKSRQAAEAKAKKAAETDAGGKAAHAEADSEPGPLLVHEKSS